MESKKRERSANFNDAEVQLLISLVTKHKQIIENKKNDAVTNKEKDAAWKKIEDCFNSRGITTTVRSWKTLKLKYEGLKKNTKKKSLQRQEMDRTGGGPSNPPEFNEIEEQVLSICSNIKGLEARHDSETISENSWDRWPPKTLKSRVSNVLKSNTETKAIVTSKLDKLCEARLELIQLQMKTTRSWQQFMEEEHKLKMLHLANDEGRKKEIHELLIKRISCKCEPAPSDLI